MTDNDQQHLANGSTSSRSYRVPSWLGARFEHAGNYLADASDAFQRAHLTIGRPVFPDETVPDKNATRWRSIILGHGLVALCSTLEALVRDSLTDWLVHTPSAWMCKSIAILKVTIGDWMGKDLTAQAYWVMNELWRSSGGPDRNPITRLRDSSTHLACRRPIASLGKHFSVIIKHHSASLSFGRCET